MLSPDYFTNKEDRLLELYRQLEDFILKDITRRLLSAGEMTATADRLIWKLKQMGESQAAIEKKLQTLTGLTRKELRALLQDAVLTSWEDDRSTLGQLGIELSNPLENAAVIRVMDAEYKKSLGELTNLTRTTMKQSQIDLINMLDEADLRVAAGVQSYSAAVCDILDRYAGRGIYVDYPSGARRTLESAVRCAVVTSLNQTAAQVTNQYIVEAGAEYVLVSAHLGARVAQKGQPELASHADWQGKVYKIRGTEPGYPNLLERTGYDVDPNTGQGTVKNPLGLHGYNCRHSHKPWDKRLRNPYADENGNLKIDSEENRKRYELQQKQRYMERSIRATKRRLIEKQEQINNPREDMDVDKLQKEYDRIAYRMTQQNKAYNDFCKANDLQPQYDRIKVSGFKRPQSAKANGAATRYQNQHKELHRDEDGLYINEKANVSSGGDGNILGTRSGGGDTSSKGKYIGKIDYEKASEAVGYFNRQIKDNAIENAVVIDKVGNIYQFVGNSNSVNISGIELDGAYITHNHPKSEGIVSFGEDDFMFLRENQNIKLFGCCNEKYEYEIEVLKDFSKLSYNEIYLEGFKFADMIDFEVQDAAMKVLEERGFIKYVKKEIER